MTNHALVTTHSVNENDSSANQDRFNSSMLREVVKILVVGSALATLLGIVGRFIIDNFAI